MTIKLAADTSTYYANKWQVQYYKLWKIPNLQP